MDLVARAAGAVNRQLFWLVLSLPPVTAPAATAALFSNGWDAARRDDPSVRDFAIAFRQYFSCVASPLFCSPRYWQRLSSVSLDIFYYITLL